MQERVLTRIDRVAVSLALAAALGTASVLGQPPTRAYPSSKRPLEANAYLPPVTGSTPWAPAWSPDGKWIAVGMSGSIWKVEPTTAVAYQLTSDRKYHASPAWSPDGRSIVYTADDGGNTIQLEILDVQSGETRALTDDAFVYADPAFSPDGSRLTYVSTNPTGYLNVYVREIKNGAWSGAPIAVTAREESATSGRPVPPVYIEPTWTRDGRSLLLVTNRNIRVIPGASDLMNTMSGEILQVPAGASGIDQARTIVSSAESYYRARPDVSPDGTRLVFSSTGGSADEFQNLYLQSLAGGDAAKLTFFSHDAFHPRWSPDGERIAYVSNEDGLPQLAVMETFYGDRKTMHIVERRWKRPMGALALRTVDATTGEVVAARIHSTASDGKLYAPADALAYASRMGDRVFHSSGAVTVEMPVGRAHVTAVKGFEFWPRAADADIKAGEVTTLTLNLDRIANLSARGWRNGSMHSHMNYEGSLHQTPERYLALATAEGEDVVTTHVVDYGSRILDREYFVPGGGAHPRSTPDRMLMVGQEIRPPLYGHLFLFGMKDHLLSPVRWSGAGGSSLFPTPTDIFRHARAQGATVGYDHAFGGENDPLEGNLGQAAGFLVDAALGTADVVTWNGASRGGFFPLYAAWNNGLKVTAIGGEDAIVNSQERRTLTGATRTYVFTGDRVLEMNAWLASVRAGHAFVTTGPLVELLVNGRIPGDDVALPDGGGTVDVDVSVRSIAALDKVLLVFNGKIVEDVPLAADRKRADFKKSIRVTESGWFHIRAEGRPADRFPLDADYAQAFTNPIWVTVGKQPIRNRMAAEYGARWVDKLQQMATTMALWRSPAEKDHVLSVFDEARQTWRRLAAEATAPTASRP